MAHTILLHTDQAACYDAKGAPIHCADTGQDGETGYEFPSAAQRFTSSGGTVFDSLTGMVWAANANLAEFPLSWSEAHAFVEDMNREKWFGCNRWRLPFRRELFSLISHARINPSLPENHPFKDVFPGYYWSGESVERLPDQAWYVHLGGGRVFKGMKHGSYMVWPVCGKKAENPPDSERFIVRDDEVLDESTGLWWTKCADLSGMAVDWQTALDAVFRLNRESDNALSAWRLPNIRELESLIDLRFHSPALEKGHPFVGVSDGYWSSTTSLYDPAYAWVLYTRDGPVGVGYKTNPEFYVWAVR